ADCTIWIPESSITSIAAYDSIEKMMDVSPAWVDEEIDNSPTVVRLLAEAEQHKERMEKIRETVHNPEMDPRYQESEQKLKKVEAQLAAERKRLRPGIVRQLQGMKMGTMPSLSLPHQPRRETLSRGSFCSLLTMRATTA